MKHFSFFKNCILLVSIFLFFTSCTQNKNEVSDDTDSFFTSFHFPHDYDTLDIIIGDLNNDNFNDKIIIYNKKNEKNLEPRIMIIYLHNGKDLIANAINFKVIGDRMCGGIYGDCYHGINIQKNSFTITYYGGSGDHKWLHHVTFTFDLQNNGFVLNQIKKTGSKSENVIPEDKRVDKTYNISDFGIVKFQNFTSSWDYMKKK